MYNNNLKHVKRSVVIFYSIPKLIFDVFLELVIFAYFNAIPRWLIALSALIFCFFHIYTSM